MRVPVPCQLNSTSYLVVGTTRGDDLIPSKEVVLAACDNPWDAQGELNRITKERNDFLAEHGDSIPWWAECTVYARFDIREVPHAPPDDHPPLAQVSPAGETRSNL